MQVCFFLGCFASALEVWLLPVYAISIYVELSAFSLVNLLFLLTNSLYLAFLVEITVWFPSLDGYSHHEEKGNKWGVLCRNLKRMRIRINCYRSRLLSKNKWKTAQNRCSNCFQFLHKKQHKPMNFERQERRRALQLPPTSCLETFFRLQHRGVTQTGVILLSCKERAEYKGVQSTRNLQDGGLEKKGFCRERELWRSPEGPHEPPAEFLHTKTAEFLHIKTP